MADNGIRKGDDALALALASGKTLRDAAKCAHVSERTASRRWADPAFRRRVTKLRAEMVSQAMGRMVDWMTEAADTLRKLLKAESDSVRLGASRTVVELGVKLRETV